MRQALVNAHSHRKEMKKSRHSKTHTNEQNYSSKVTDSIEAFDSIGMSQTDPNKLSKFKNELKEDKKHDSSDNGEKDRVKSGRSFAKKLDPNSARDDQKEKQRKSLTKKNTKSSKSSKKHPSDHANLEEKPKPLPEKNLESKVLKTIAIFPF